MEWEDARLYLQEHRALLLDIRTRAEHSERRIPGSLHLSHLELNAASARKVLGNPGTMVLVYCRSGLHSGPAAEKLRRYGYNAYDMGSLEDWPWGFEGTMSFKY